jgi:hypothetical protein
MKKRLIVVLALLATVVGMAFALYSSAYKYSDCYHYYVPGAGKVSSGELYKNASITSVPGKCPYCQEKERKEAEEALKKEQAKTQNACDYIDAQNNARGTSGTARACTPGYEW